MKRKLLSVLLATVLLLTCIPFSAVSAATLVWPVPGHKTLSQGYHNNNAIDISDGSIANATVVAAMGGTVSGIYLCGSQHYGSMGDCDGFGTGLVIRGDDGRTYQYAHMAPNSIPANVYYGARVASGQTIGKVGTTGNSSGYHLHFAISNTANYWEAGPNPANESYTDQVASLKIKYTQSCDYRVTIPANYKLTLYWSATDTTPAEVYLSAQSSAYTLRCTQKVVFTDLNVRYKFTSGDGYVLYFTVTSAMSEAVYHSYTNSCDTSCNNCGDTRSVTHSYAAATCTKAKTCQTCGATSGSALGHSYADATCTKAKTCTICGATSGSALGHDYADATCLAPKTCSTCGHTEGDKQDHAWKKGTCSICGEVSPKTLSITTQPKSATANVYELIVLAVSATGEGLTYNWYASDVTDNGKYWRSGTKFTNIYDITLTPERIGRKVYCIVTDKYGNTVKSKTVTIGVNKLPISLMDISLSKTSYTYNGKVQKPTVTVLDPKGYPLTKGTDYTVTYSDESVDKGTYKVTVKMKGNYSGTKTLTYKINPIDVSKCKVSLSASSYTYNGKVKKPTVTVINHKGTKLKNVHYTVTYATGRKNVGKYKVTIKMRDNYSGTKTLYFKINPAKTTLSSLTAGSKKLTVKWTKKSTQVTGYQIQYSTSKSFKSYKTKNVTSYKTASTSLTGLKAKTTYYVRVRTYKTVNGKKVYSGWSTIKYKKTK